MEILLKFTALVILFFTFFYVIKIFSLKGISFELGYVIGILYFILIPIVIFLLLGEFEKPVMKNLIMLRDVTLENGLKPVLYLITCTVISFITIFLLNNKDEDYNRFNNNDLYSLESIALAKRWIFAISALYLGVMFFDALLNGIFSGGGHWYKSRHDNMVSGSGLFYVGLGYLKHALKVIVPAVLIFYWHKKILQEKYFWIFYLTFLIIDVYLTGNRFIIASSLICVSLVLIQQKRLTQLFPILLASFPIMWFGTVYMQVRQVIHQVSSSEVFDLFAEKSANSSTQFIDLIKNAVEGINFNTFVSIFYDFPERISYLYGSSFIKPFVFFIPRSVWADKPERISQVVGFNYSGDPYLSLVTTFFGEGWGNFGFIFFIFIPLFILFKRYFLSKIFGFFPFMPILLFLISFGLIRSSFGAVLIDSMIMFVILIFLKFLVDRSFKVKFI